MSGEWSLAALLLEPGAWVTGNVFNRFMLKLSPITTIATPGLLLLIALSGLAHDLQKQADTQQATHTAGAC